MILTCLTTVLLNISAIDYNAQDYKNLARASYVCGEKEGCLKSFQKREQGIYRAMCGKKQEFDKNSFDKVELDVILYELRNLSLEEKKIKLRAIGLEVK
jgi:hypothetical protein